MLLSFRKKSFWQNWFLNDSPFFSRNIPCEFHHFSFRTKTPHRITIIILVRPNAWSILLRNVLYLCSWKTTKKNRTNATLTTVCLATRWTFHLFNPRFCKLQSFTSYSHTNWIVLVSQSYKKKNSKKIANSKLINKKRRKLIENRQKSKTKYFGPGDSTKLSSQLC